MATESASRTRDLYSSVAKSTGFPTPLVETVGKAVIDALLAEMSKGNKIRHDGAGTFRANTSSIGTVVIKYRPND